MKVRQWMQIAAVASAVGLSGTALANGLERTSHDMPATTSDDADARLVAPQAATPDRSLNGAMNGAAQLDSGTRGGAAAALPDDSGNAAMNPAAQLGGSTPGAPASIVDERGGASSGATAPNARTPGQATDEESMGRSAQPSGTRNETLPAGRSDDALPSDDRLPGNDTLPNGASSADKAPLNDPAGAGAIVLPSDRFDAASHGDATENMQGK